MRANEPDLELEVLSPQLQVDFHYRLETLRDVYLRNVLRQTVAALEVAVLDDQLAQYVSPNALQKVAAHGLRGERVFPVPCVLSATPYLLGYYRLLYGLSQKAFYSKGPYGRFKQMEERGQLTTPARAALVPLCRSLCQTGEELVTGIDAITPDGLHELQLLTLGAQFRGSALNQIGQDAVRQVLGLIRDIVGPARVLETASSLTLTNASQREVRIVFAHDPDVRIVEELPTGEQPRVSIEIKGGGDRSNVYNRIGEAEKSHLKARRSGYFEFWTIVGADFNPERAAIDSPTTGYFFRLDRILQPDSEEHPQFRDRLCTVTGIPTGT